MSSAHMPAASVIVVSASDFRSIRKTVRHLREQTIVHDLELVLVGPDAALLQGEDAEVAPFTAVQRVSVGEIKSSAAARAAGVAVASAPIIAIAEDHCYPEPEWAEEFVAVHRDEKVAAVGPRIRNGNPGLLLSWVNLLIEYGPWLAAPEGDAEHLPGHNSSYKRAPLLEYGDKLGKMLEAESILHWDLRAQGYSLRMAPRMQARHVNFSLLRSSLRLRYLVGRLFAGARVRGWPVYRRLAYALGTPVIPLLRLRRTWRVVQDIPELRDRRASLMPVLAVFLVFDTIGEFVSYLFGAGNVDAELTAMEFQRDRYVVRSERHLVHEPE